MASNRGKDFEERFKEDWDKCFPGTLIFRLKDQMNGFKQTSQNPCDFIGFPGKDTLFMIECKSHNGASLQVLLSWWPLHSMRGRFDSHGIL